ncbi:hypothetical protein GCM10010275_47100 [Streptomyces litmocidini]|uniref:hypothetical protein n=1 Tax=Streptomyces litmocidini TaxID=67318 RepID=UPI00167CDBBE|nr:hypothetical protein [Streptomyces litmocidini]GGV02606.1 hypothetical protein GCM10010275_47100 [Streptomyces litmocidini]
MHAPRRTAVTALLCAALALGTTACGPFSDDAKPTGPFGDLSGSQIVDKAFAATKGAKALTVDIDQRAAADPVKAYLSLDDRGRCTGTLTTGATNTIELIKPDGKDVYLRFDEASLREQVKDEDAETQKATIKSLKGRWLKGPVSDPDNKDMLELCDLKRLLSGFEQGASGIVKGAETTVGGRKALALTEPGGGGESSTVYVATQGTPYVLRIVTKGGEEPGTITFSNYGKPVGAEAPAAKDVVETE